jgi:uncharacterized protein YndB with AHSA1/START domain
MNISWTGTITIAAPIERVYAYLADLPRHAEWAQSVQQLVAVRAGDEHGVGAVFRATERQVWQADRRPREPLTAGAAGEMMCELTELVTNRRIAWRAWVPVPILRHEGRYAFDLEPAAGGTRLTQTSQLADNWLGDLVSRLVFKTTAATARAQWEASLANIKLILEEHAAPAAAPEALRTGGASVA